MAGELLDVIRGPVGLEDELSGRTRRLRSSSRIGLGSRRPSAVSVRSVEASQKGLFGGDDSTELDEVYTPQTARPNGVEGSNEDEQLGSAVETDLEVTAGTIEDLGWLGEGASGEVRKVMHRPSGLIMAKKVSRSRAWPVLKARTLSSTRAPSRRADHRHLTQPKATQTTPARAPFHARVLQSCHCAVLRRLPRRRMSASRSLPSPKLNSRPLCAQNNSQIGICMEYCEAGSLDTLYKKVKAHGWRTGEKVLGKIAESVSARST